MPDIEPATYSHLESFILKLLVKRRPDLKIIIMSSTFDMLKFRGYFGISCCAIV